MTEISRRKTEMSRAEALQKEMAGAVRLLGSDGRTADEANTIASRMTGLPVTVIERLRWKKIKRPFADVTDVETPFAEDPIAPDTAWFGG